MKKNFIKVILANFVFLIIGLLSNFLLPKFLSMEVYSDLKTYTLYLSYAGLFTLGYADSIFLKYGGKKINSIDNKEFSKDIINYVYLELIVSCFVFIISFFIKDIVLTFFSVGMIAENILWYYRLFYQAVGEFNEYGKVLNWQKVVLLIVELILIFLFHKNDSVSFLGVTVIVPVIMAVVLAKLFNKRGLSIEKTKLEYNVIKKHIKNGFILMLGNLANTLFTGIDRWFIKILMNSIDFAIYAFAVSMENIVNLFITPISVSLYNVLCNKKDIEYKRRLKRVVLIWGMIIISAAYPAKYILEKFLTNYIAANNIIFYLFATQVFYAVIKGIYLNIYKAENKQDIYLKQTCMMIIISIVLNILLYSIFHTLQSFAIATLITSIIWFIMCDIFDKEIRYKINEYIYIIFEIAIYLLSGMYLNSINGLIIYIVITIILSCVFMNSTVKYLWNCCIEILKGICKKN